MKWHNKFDNRLMLLCSSIFLFFFVVNSSLDLFEYKSEQKHWRDTNAEKYKRFFINLFNNEYEQLLEFVYSYASDDQLYQIVNNHQTLNKFSASFDDWSITSTLLHSQNERYIKQRLAPSLLANNQFNTVFVQDNNGQIIHSVSDLELSLHRELSGLMQEVNNDNKKGLVIVQQRIFYYVKTPIFDSQKNYTSNGYLTVFSLLNGKKVDNISQSMDKSLFLIDSEAMQKNVRFKLDDSLVAREINRQQLAYFDSFTYDLFADAELLLPFKINLKLTVNNNRITTFYIRLAIQLGVFLLSTFVALYLIKRFVTKPLGNLLRDMHMAETTLKLPEQRHSNFLLNSELGGLYLTHFNLQVKTSENHR